MKWRVLTEKNPGWVEADNPIAYHAFMEHHSEVVEADTMFINNGTLMFSVQIQPDAPEPVELCGVSMVGVGACARAAGHVGKHLAKLKPKWKAKPKLLCIRAFNATAWNDVTRIEE